MKSTTEKENWRVYLKRNWGILIVGAFLFLFGIRTNFQWGFERSLGTLYLCNLIPGIALLATWFLASKHQQKRWSTIAFGLVIALLTTFVAFYMNVSAAFFKSATTPVTDVSRYTEIREQMGDSELTLHFPLSIPENAKNIHFEYLPKFLQGGGHLQLRMELPQSEINELMKKFQSQAKYKFIGGDRSDHANMVGGVPTTYFYTSGTDEYSFDDSYEILVLNAEAGGTPDFQWNHGFSYGVIISLEKYEIIYWAEYW